ncbi:MAG: hypothetical protein R3359_00385 [Marinirhabdus sp.]|nr:hypothetical protein [Marinirhabdus sp.]
MKEKKNIDQLFKEKFQDFEATPSPAVWESIEAKLQTKKKPKRVIPLWWRAAGVAALLALLFTIGNSIYNSDTNPSTEIVTEESAVPVQENEITTSNTEVASESADDSEQHTNTEALKKANDSHSATQNENEFAPQKQTTDRISGTTETTTASTSEIQSDVKRSPTTETKTTPTYNTNKEAVAAIENAKTEPNKNAETTFNPLVKEPTKVVSEKVGIAKTETAVEGPLNEVKKETVTDPAQTSEIETAAAETSEEAAKKTSIFDAIAENESLKEETTQQEEMLNRWAVSPNVGPVYYGSLSDGSSIDPMFSDNGKTGDVNLSYGVQVAYDVSDKFSVRSGVNNVNLSYATGDVQVASAPAAFGLKNVDYASRATAITTVYDRGAIPSSNTESGFQNIVPKSTGGNAEISQQLQYYEVPLELKYDIVESRLGINVIGGMSTLFLGNNEVVVNDGSFRTVLGEANNLNSISFTTNIGLGFNYQLSKKLKFNIEPMFKYQLNPYTDTSIDFRPYYLGVYSGLSFKF